MAITLQKPAIVEIEGSTLRIHHPDISGYTRTYVASPIAAAGTTLTIIDNNGLNKDNADFIIGYPGDGKTEPGKVNESDPVSRDGTLTIDNTLAYGHELDSPVTRIFETSIAIYSSDAVDGTLTEVVAPASAINIQWDKPFTEYTYEGAAVNYFVVKFYDGTTLSAASDYVASTGLTAASVAEMVKGALMMANETIREDVITKDFLMQSANDWQDRVTHYVDPKGRTKDWNFELIENKTSLSITENETSYALSGLTLAMKYPDSKQGILNVRIGSENMEYQDMNEYDDDMEDNINATVATEAAAAATSLVLSDTYEFTESGSIDVPGQSAAVTYTTNTEATSTLSGIPATGTGRIENTLSVGDNVWQGVTAGDPTKYSVFDGNLLFNIPPNNDWASYPIKLRYLSALTRFSDFSDTTSVTFYHLAKYFIAARIEERKGNFDRADRLYAYHDKYLAEEAQRDKTYIMDTFQYYDADIEDYDIAPSKTNSADNN